MRFVRNQAQQTLSTTQDHTPIKAQGMSGNALQMPGTIKQQCRMMQVQNNSRSLITLPVVAAGLLSLLRPRRRCILQASTGLHQIQWVAETIFPSHRRIMPRGNQWSIRSNWTGAQTVLGQTLDSAMIASSLRTPTAPWYGTLLASRKRATQQDSHPPWEDRHRWLSILRTTSTGNPGNPPPQRRNATPSVRRCEPKTDRCPFPAALQAGLDPGSHKWLLKGHEQYQPKRVAPAL
ncbi:MAG: hypothetical protein CBB71_08805 [Rhodopirellula sp. TMED11]|nr:MAG: hypothetical protein CBB71_08805 [Rhodopirellula sp. TMED11]